MSSPANVLIHASQFPEQVRRDLLASLRMRRVNHKFHYDSVKQTQKWLALHQAYSPARNDADCQAVYEKGFAAAAAQIKSRRVEVIGLGCGGGQKDTRLLKRLKAHGRNVFYTPCDVSPAMVLTARETALVVLPEENCFPLVCDLTTAGNLQNVIWEGRRVGDPNYSGTATRRPSRHTARLITFFGMIPNFEPQDILPRLAALIRPNDFLLFSANLAPGPDYAVGVKKILPQYDNALTRNWLMAFLLDLGVGRRDGDLRFAIEEGRFGLKRIVARFHFRRGHQIKIENKAFNFKAGDSIQVFFSYRYTPERVGKILARYGLEVCNQWVLKSEEEGVFLCRQSGGTSYTSLKSKD
ncbi:MAG TPA: L-histidine N(alpha)-methyltransferase [Candidatus Sulfopaludibacter sp.]|nr:L-histidine N(alpha)-methyltransferase [Candidatus Sulfopaludibacter sp.]